MKYILDSNVWIYFFQDCPEIEKVSREIKDGGVIPVLTPVVFSEVLGWSGLWDDEATKIRDFFSTMEKLEIGASNWEEIIRWRRSGVKKKLADLLIASSAVLSRLPILTRNIRDFYRLGVVVEDPWESVARKNPFDQNEQ